MGQAIGEVLALGVGVALSPLAVVAVVVILAAPHGRRSAAAYVAAWALGLASVATLVVLVADEANAGEDGAPADWVSIVKIVVGLLLLVVAWRQLRARTGAEGELPSWMSRLDGITAARSAGLALLLACVKPKNLLLTVAAAVATAQTGASAGGQAIALAVFVVLGTLGVGIPLGIDLLMPERGADVLRALRAWMIRENAAIIAILCLVLAAKLIGDALAALTG